MVALDKCTRENGCLQVVQGSHLMGRIDHGVMTRQPGRRRSASRRRDLEAAWTSSTPRWNRATRCSSTATRCIVRIRTAPRNRRWTVLFCYNAARNNPYVEHHHPFYTPLVKVADSAIKEAGLKMASGTNENFMNRPHVPPEIKTKVAEGGIKPR